MIREKRAFCVRLCGLLLAACAWQGGAAFAAAAPGNAPPVVMAFNTYAQAPFVKAGGGLAADCVAYLNQKLAGSYQLRLDTIPRSRLLRLELANPAAFQGIVLFLNPRFVDDALQQRYLWTDGLFKDGNVLVFRGPHAPPLHSLEDLAGMRFGGTLDIRYQALSTLVERRVITRIDSYTLRDSLAQVAAGRVDFTQTNGLTFRAMAQQPEFSGNFVSVPVPAEAEFSRQIFVGRRNVELAERLRAIVKAMPGDPEWQVIADRYALKLPGTAASHSRGTGKHPVKSASAP